MAVSTAERVPYNELERLEALHKLEVLDTAPEPAFDRITRLASKMLGTPIALVSLIDAERQWSKSAHGIEPSQMARNDAFCSHAVMQNEVMVVPNASKDVRFEDNTLVTSAPKIRFYAGAPLIVGEDLRLGTLCVVDTQPRELSAVQREVLRDLAAIAVDELKLRMLVKTQAETNAALELRSRELEFANESLDQFAYMASHDLRGPLKTIKSMAEIATSKASEANRVPLAFMRKAAQDLEDMVLGYRRLSQLTFCETQQVSLGDLVHRAQGQAGLALEVEVLDDMRIPCDPVLMTQVLTNLMSNAARYASEPKMRVSAQAMGTSVVLRAENPVRTAVSVDPTIFAPFKRLTTGGEGTGLGLAIVERIAKLHGGQVTAGCSDTAFWVELVLPA